MNIRRLAMFGCAAGALIAVSPPALSAGGTRAGVIVRGALGGAILGYDVDQNGTEGILSEYFTLQNGNSNVATETFDQSTGQILSIVKHEKNTLNDFASQPVVGTGVGLVLCQIVKSGHPIKNIYKSLDPLDGGKFTGKWTPKLAADEAVASVSEDQGQVTTGFMMFEFNDNAQTSLFTSNVAQNTFGQRVKLTDTIFDFDTSPVMAYDSATNTVIVASSIGCRSCGTKLALANMASGSVSEFTGLGLGTVNGIAVDTADGIAVTTTTIDFSVEFYDLAKQTGFKVTLQGAEGEAQSGADVQYDPINKLFLVGQGYSSIGTGSGVQVFDTKGNFVEDINGLISGAHIALNPNTRTAFMIEDNLNALQSFQY